MLITKEDDQGNSNNEVELNRMKIYCENNNKITSINRTTYLIAIVVGGIVDNFLLENLKKKLFMFIEVKKLRPTCNLVKKKKSISSIYSKRIY